MRPVTQTTTTLPAAVEHVLENMRVAITGQPEYLLETFGGPSTIPGVHVLADLYGFEDELVVGGMRMPRSEPYVLTPIMSRPSLATFDPLTWSGPRTARYERLSCYAMGAVAPEHAPGWDYDMQSCQVRLMLVRYRRTA